MTTENEPQQSGSWHVFRTYRREIVSAVIGALLSLAVSLVLGIQRAHDDFQSLVRKELNQQLANDITALHAINDELAQSVELLLNEKMTPEIVVKPYEAKKEMVKSRLMCS